MDPSSVPSVVPETPPKSPIGPDNPGTVEDLHKRAQNVFPMYFEGAKLLVNKGLSNHFQVSHTLTMSSTMPSGYRYGKWTNMGTSFQCPYVNHRFGATYVGTNMLSPSEAYPLLLADTDPSGNLNANVVLAPSDRTRFKMIAQIQQSKWQSTQMTTDYKGDLYTVKRTLHSLSNHAISS